MSVKFRGILFALLGVILIVTGIFAVYELYRRTLGTSANQQSSQPVIAMTKAVIAAQDIPLGKLLTQEDVIQVEVPAEAVPPNTLSSVEDAINRFVKVDLVTGEMVMAHNLADPTNVNHDVAFILGEHYVMLAFPATDLMSRQNIIKRGDIVDILATLSQDIMITKENGDEETLTKLYTFDALQGTEVTALVLKVIEDTNTQSQTGLSGESEEKKPPMTETLSYLLALRPQDALMLKHLKDADAVFDIVLRAPTSTSLFDLNPISAEYMMESYGLE